jgi:MFS family permease
MEHERRTVFLATAVHGLVHVQMVLFPGVLALIAREFGLDPAQMGLIGTVSYAAFGLGAIPAGYLADVFGARRVLRALLGGATLSSLLVAWSPGIPVLATGLFLLGLSNSLYHPAGLGLVSRAAARGRALAVHGVGGSLGLALAPGLAAGIAALFGGSWRVVYLFGAGGSAALLALFLFLERPERAVGRTGETPARAPQETRTTLLPLAVSLAIMSILGVVYRGTITFLPKHLGDVLTREVSPETAVTVGGLLTTGALLLGVAGQWLGGAVLFHRFRLEALYLALLLPCVGGLVMLGLGGLALSILGAALFSFFFFADQPVGNGLLASYTSERRRSTGYGVHFTLGFGLGSLGAAIAGYAYQSWGPGWAFLLMGILGGISVLLALLLNALAPRHAPPPPEEAARRGI